VSFGLAKLLARTRYVSMPNHLVDRPVVPEYLQHQATASNLSRELSEFLDDDGRRCQVRKVLGGIANMLRKNANAAVAEQLLQVAGHYR
jgi:lipid-A-disaccharide synthase